MKEFVVRLSTTARLKPDYAVIDPRPVLVFIYFHAVRYVSVIYHNIFHADVQTSEKTRQPCDVKDILYMH